MGVWWQQAWRPSQPFIRNASAAGVLFVAADAVAQYMEARRHHHATLLPQQLVQNELLGDDDIKAGLTSPGYNYFVLDQWRCLGATLLGVVLGGGVYPTAYAKLDALLPGNSWRTLIVKSAVEISTVGIAVNTASLLGRASWQGTRSWESLADHVSAEIPRVTFMDARVWFPYNLLAFGWIPITIRPLTTACMEAGWQTYISLRAHDCPEEETTPEEGVATA
jgi:hypothetical protein